MSSPPAPSSHGSLDEAREAQYAGASSGAQRGRDQPEAAADDEDGFDSDEFREWLRDRRRNRGQGSLRDRGRRSGQRDEDDEDGGEKKGFGGPSPPEWMERVPFRIG